MATKIISDNSLTAVANAIRSKGGTSAPLTFPNGFVSAIQDIETGGSTVSAVQQKDVNFIDYDGTILYSYSAAQALNLSELPENPIHTGLTSQGWNWSLADMKAQVTALGKCDIGQIYITDDGKTRIYIHLEEERKSPMLGICPNGTVDIDWGDGSEHDTLTGTSLTAIKHTNNHNYSHGGDYIIKLTVTGTAAIYGSSSTNNNCRLLHQNIDADTRNRYYINSIVKVEIGNNIELYNYAFYTCYALKSITIPNNTTNIYSYSFASCLALKYVTIPNNANTLISEYCFSNCYALKKIILSNNILTIGNSAFNSCYNLQDILIPKNVQSIGASTFQYCYSFQNIIIPDSVTNIGNYAFNTCSNVKNLIISKNITTINKGTFASISSCAKIIIPENVANIKAEAFFSCTSVAEIHILSTTPPQLASTNAFNNIYSDCIFYVPYSEDHSILEAYKAATNWSTYASYMVQEDPT